MKPEALQCVCVRMSINTIVPWLVLSEHRGPPLWLWTWLPRHRGWTAGRWVGEPQVLQSIWDRARTPLVCAWPLACVLFTFSLNWGIPSPSTYPVPAPPTPSYIFLCDGQVKYHDFMLRQKHEDYEIHSPCPTLLSTSVPARRLLCYFLW